MYSIEDRSVYSMEDISLRWQRLPESIDDVPISIMTNTVLGSSEDYPAVLSVYDVHHFLVLIFLHGEVGAVVTPFLIFGFT